MKKYRLFYFFMTSLILGCGPATTPKPERLIPVALMDSIIYEMAVINAAKGLDKKRLAQSIKNPRQHVFKTFGVDSMQFVASNAYYASKPKIYDRIYTAVETRLAAEKAVLEQQITLQKKKDDSINKAARRQRQNFRDSTMVSQPLPDKLQ